MARGISVCVALTDTVDGGGGLRCAVEIASTGLSCLTCCKNCSRLCPTAIPSAIEPVVDDCPRTDSGEYDSVMHRRSSLNMPSTHSGSNCTIGNGGVFSTLRPWISACSMARTSSIPQGVDINANFHNDASTAIVVGVVLVEFVGAVFSSNRARRTSGADMKMGFWWNYLRIEEPLPGSCLTSGFWLLAQRVNRVR